MTAKEKTDLKNTREVLEAIQRHPEATASIKLAVAIALDHLDAGDSEEALAVINEFLLDGPR
ncbi:hypothetical protein [Candidatus Poriferisocius sp.]|uniref:hypothetical protein n=1 Tax=Candidatus Poriferisocius sp. TaxID=3101276 RepID=UPI003B018085